ncbi:MAG: hypothetical protein JWM56_1021 [Candidatus Peribacteria bacterium]|nr:hypothetical protein [Candidatus Peribacteria bacterium]
MTGGAELVPFYFPFPHLPMSKRKHPFTLHGAVEAEFDDDDTEELESVEGTEVDVEEDEISADIDEDDEDEMTPDGGEEDSFRVKLTVLWVQNRADRGSVSVTAQLKTA